MKDALEKRLARNIAGHMKDLRAKKGLTQTELALKANMRQCHISRLEHGNRLPTIAVLWRVCEALDTTASSFLAEIRA